MEVKHYVIELDWVKGKDDSYTAFYKDFAMTVSRLSRNLWDWEVVQGDKSLGQRMSSFCGSMQRAMGRCEGVLAATIS